MSVELGQLIWIAIALPLASSIFIHFFGRYLKEPLPGVLASLSIGTAFLLAFVAALPFFEGGAHGETVLLWEWMPAIGANLGDSVGSTCGDDDPDRHRPSAPSSTSLPSATCTATSDSTDSSPILNLFAASMLTLVLAGNYAMLFLGWELVGLCSYLLVGFWLTRPSAAAAAKKAFVVNRIGDFGLMIGLMLVFRSLRHDVIRRSVRTGRFRAHHGDGNSHHPLVLRRSGRQVGSDPSLRVATRCNGRSDTGLSPHPRRDHGHGGACTCSPALRPSLS